MPKRNPPPIVLSSYDRLRLRAETGCDERTIRAYPNVREASRKRIEHAAKIMGIRLPSAA